MQSVPRAGVRDFSLRMRTAYSMTVRPMEAVFRLLTVLLAASYCQAAGVDQTGKVNSSLIANLLGKTDSYRCTVSDVSGVNSTELQVVASQPLTVSCDAPSPLGKYDSYCEGLRADYFLLPKQQKAPSLIGLSPNVSTFITSLNDTVTTFTLVLWWLSLQL